MQEQEQGKEGFPSIVMEAVCDYNLWFWHISFSYAGSLNDINIWDQSPFLTKFLDGKYSQNIDFLVEMWRQQFTQLCLAVDGIYPALACFVKTIQEPT